MNRRKFVGFSVLGTAAVMAVPGIALAIPVERAVRGIISRELHYLTLDPASLDRYAAQCAAQRSRSGRAKIRTIYALGLSTEHFGETRNIVQDYLLGSDFFEHRMDERRTVMYRGPYDPYRLGCSNPFISAYYPRQPM